MRSQVGRSPILLCLLQNVVLALECTRKLENLNKCTSKLTNRKLQHFSFFPLWDVHHVQSKKKKHVFHEFLHVHMLCIDDVNYVQIFVIYRGVNYWIL